MDLFGILTGITILSCGVLKLNEHANSSSSSPPPLSLRTR